MWYENKLYWKSPCVLRLLYNHMEWEWRMKMFRSACSQSKFILMWLHHIVWWGVIGEDYDGFERVRTSTCLHKVVVSSWFLLRIFPRFSLWGFYGVLYWISAHWRWFCPSIFPMGVSGFIFHGAIQSGILRFGIPFCLEGSVWWYCWAICRARKDDIA